MAIDKTTALVALTQSAFCIIVSVGSLCLSEAAVVETVKRAEARTDGGRCDEGNAEDSCAF